eukprot:CAMPEP_0113637364 /NCGR_PEP_ID=MMETSP0017_2-20120614/19554_1 /TAXON_ID=2856 /ORGANISM="Cylindrotheca closterium" /LENGTH=188 /DNA_ID=CAMNT_0000548381 /DNA_START=63 /DNA_END=625 /DNA_ORIENTATION=+ /assembly_acc=CAM_ASM_000147
MSTENAVPSQEPSSHLDDNPIGDLPSEKTLIRSRSKRRSPGRKHRSGRSHSPKPSSSISVGRSKGRNGKDDNRSPGRKHRSGRSHSPKPSSSRSVGRSKERDGSQKSSGSLPRTKPSDGQKDRNSGRNEKERRSPPASVAGVVSVSGEDSRVTRKANGDRNNSGRNEKERRSPPASVAGVVSVSGEDS